MQQMKFLATSAAFMPAIAFKMSEHLMQNKTATGLWPAVEQPNVVCINAFQEVSDQAACQAIAEQQGKKFYQFAPTSGPPHAKGPVCAVCNSGAVLRDGTKWPYQIYGQVSWVPGAWIPAACPTACGSEGEQSRSVECKDTEGRPVDDSNCPASSKPATESDCPVTEPCTTPAPPPTPPAAATTMACPTTAHPHVVEVCSGLNGDENLGGSSCVVNALTKNYAPRSCKKFCEAVGLTCVGSASDVGGKCSVGKYKNCDKEYSGQICACNR